ncbi:MAG: hypothetical protein QOG63_566 [Thermoleophilaceae bacterium]|nr:hypothetical protein [Thermoleophilaceae bacterium]
MLAACKQPVAEQDKSEIAGKYPVRVLSADFPKSQHLAKDSTMNIIVENAGNKRIPEVNVTVKCPGPGLGGSFNTVVSDSDVADPERPQFIVNTIPTRTARKAPPLDPAPLERSSAFVDTYPLGPLEPGAKARFRWDVTAVKAGPYRLCWKVNAGLYGKAVAIAAAGSNLPVSGEFKGEVSNTPPQAHVGGPNDSTVIEGQANPGR